MLLGCANPSCKRNAVKGKSFKGILYVRLIFLDI
nr:MAG TPA: hypothetical protein [Caudoviricetes sp.]